MDLEGGAKKKSATALKRFAKAKKSLSKKYPSYKRGTAGYRAVCAKLARSKSLTQCAKRSKKRSGSKSKSKKRSGSKKRTMLARIRAQVCK